MELVGSSIGRPLDERYLVICLENLRFEVMMISSCKCISYSIALLYSFFSFLVIILDRTLVNLLLMILREGYP